MSIRKLANKTGLSKGVISNLELGINKNPNIKTLELISEGLDMNFTQFIIKLKVDQKKEEQKAQLNNKEYKKGEFKG